MHNEAQNVIDRYERRKANPVPVNSGNFYFSHYIQAERELKYLEIIKSRFSSLDEVRLLEIGAGIGANLYFFKRIGLSWEHIHANELLSDRYLILKETFPGIHTYEGDACEMDESLNNSFDIVFQSTVFTSILDAEFKQKLADKMWALLKPNGIILWYDFAFDNPANKDVKGIKRKEIKELFKASKNSTFSKATLAPPIGRRVKRLYPFFNLFPFLRTHLIGVIEKS